MNGFLTNVRHMYILPYLLACCLCCLLYAQGTHNINCAEQKTIKFIVPVVTEAENIRSRKQTQERLHIFRS